MTNPSLWSINKLAAELGMDRRKLALDLEGCKPVEERQIGSRIERRYTLATAVRHLIHRNAASTGTDGAEGLNAREEQARLWRATRISRELDNDERAAKLIPASEVEIEFSAIIKSFVGFLEQIPDILERDTGISGHVVERLQAVVDRERERLYQEIQARVNRADGGTGSAS